jgi:hypothetical protein
MELDLYVRVCRHSTQTPASTLLHRSAGKRVAFGQQKGSKRPKSSLRNCAQIRCRKPAEPHEESDCAPIVVKSSFLWNKPVTPEVAGSSPVAPVKSLQIGMLCCLSRRTPHVDCTDFVLICRSCGRRERVRAGVRPGRPRTVEVVKTEDKGSEVNLATSLLLNAFKSSGKSSSPKGEQDSPGDPLNPVPLTVRTGGETLCRKSTGCSSSAHRSGATERCDVGIRPAPTPASC